jgi:hypothetical protein
VLSSVLGAGAVDSLSPGSFHSLRPLIEMRSIIRRSAILLVLALGVACGGDTGTANRESAVGSYQLTAVNDVPLPWTQQAYGPEIKVTGGQLVLGSDGSYSETIVRSSTTPTGTTTTSTTATTGTYTIGNQVLAFASSTGETGLGALTYVGLDKSVGANSYRYVKQ